MAFRSINVLTVTKGYGTISIFTLNTHWNLPKNDISRRLMRNCKASINRNFNANKPSELLQSTTEALLAILLPVRKSRELVWQWLFSAKTLTLITRTQEYRRYHWHESHVQKAIKRAVRKSQIPKRVSAHTFRRSFASHLLQANYDIRTIQESLGHSDLKNTMIYTHTVQSVTIKQAKSPLDF